MKKQKGFIIPAMIIIVLVLSIGGGSYVYLENKKVNNIKTTNEEVTTLSTSTDMKTSIATATTPLDSSMNTEFKQDVSVNADKDIQAVYDIMLKYKAAYESGDTRAVESLFSKATRDLFANVQGSTHVINKGSKVSIGNITHSGKNMRVESTEIKSNGSTESAPLILILENGQWKIDLNATMEALLKPSTVVTGDSNGYVDLVVTGIKVYPSHPIVNSEDVEIAVTIKNMGTKISQKGAPAVATILENTAYTPTQGGSISPLGAGESVTWKFDMYGQNKIFKRSDVSGKKTIKVELNGYKDVVEKNYNNNSFTYSFEVFEK